MDHQHSLEIKTKGDVYVEIRLFIIKDSKKNLHYFHIVKMMQIL